jgi:light-regulated signal transduction histidine kinase (bacteriophytochrome)
LISTPALIATGSHRASAVCDHPSRTQESIRIPNTFQPHGAFLTVRSDEQASVVAASSNVAAMLWGSSSSGEVIGRRFAGIQGTQFAADVQTRCQKGRLRGEAPWHCAPRLLGKVSALDVTAHTHPGLINAELERAGARDPADAPKAMRRRQNLIINLRNTGVGKLSQQTGLQTEVTWPVRNDKWDPGESRPARLS